MNCGDIDWSNLCSPSDGVHDTLLNFTVQQGYSQLVTQPTRNNNILDLLLTNEPVSICDVSVQEPFSTSDHCQVCFKVFVEQLSNEEKYSNGDSYFRCWNAADYDSMSAYFSTINWDRLFSYNLTVDSMWSAFSDVLYTAINLFVPIRSIKKVKNPRARHYPTTVKRAAARKKCLWRKLRAKPDCSVTKTAYKLAADKYRLMVRNYEIKKERNLIASNNTGQFFNFVNRKLSSKSGIGAIRNNDGKLVSGDKQRADTLNTYFSSVCKKDNGDLPNIEQRVDDDVRLEFVHFDQAAVMKAMKKLKPNQASGPDGIPPQLFKRVGHCLAEPLSVMFSSFFSANQVPIVWSKAVVTPIFKGGDSCDASNYRPISLTCVACKLMERIIAAQVLDYLRVNSLISKQQHGFLSRHSTITNLLQSVNDWTLALNNRQNVAIAYIDYAKAFDVVSHVKLLHKLSAYGIAGDLLAWIRAFLTGRSQCTRINLSYSEYARIESGVVQGSVLGPLLFLLYINDVTDVFNNDCKCKLYADDIKIYSVLDNVCDGADIQVKLDELQNWSDQWQLDISYKKCNALLLTNKKEKTSLALTLCDKQLPIVDSVKDIGVIMDSHLKFDVHVNNIVLRAHKIANLIHKCFISKDPPTLMKAFLVYVRPVLEYASCVWSPQSVGLIKKIESVQRRFTKRFPCCRYMTYNDRLVKLNIDSLELRRLRLDLIYVYKIIFGLVATNMSDYFSLQSTNDYSVITRRGNPYKLFVNHCRINVRKNFFCERIVKVWNSLPPSIVNFKSLSSFRNSLNNVNLRIYTMY